jgi:tetratricopeptide (TPR) repeat protein
MFMRFSVVSVLAFCAGQALAQTPSDYYAARLTPGTTELLKNVEGYHLEQGIGKLRGGRPDYAWGDFDFILRYFPNHPRALMLMGDMCEAWRDPKCNMEHYLDKAIKMSPENDGVYVAKGVYLQRRKRIKEAIENYKKALEFNPGSANAHYNLGLAYVATKQYELANEHAQKAYGLGMTFPGLQSKLVAVGAWKALPSPSGEAADTTKADANGGDSRDAQQGAGDGAK